MLCLTGTVKDAAAFEAFCKEISKGETKEHRKKADLSFMTTEQVGRGSLEQFQVCLYREFTLAVIWKQVSARQRSYR